MTLMTGLRHDERLAGLVGLSGYLPLAAKTEAERHAANRDVPIFLAHGKQDPVIPIARARASRDALSRWATRVEWHEYAMPHSVCAEEIADLERWLLDVLALTTASSAPAPAWTLARGRTRSAAVRHEQHRQPAPAARRSSRR